MQKHSTKTASRKTPRKTANKPERNKYWQEAIDLGVDDPDLDSFATYFGRAFEYDTEPMVVLIGLLMRLAAVSESEHHKVTDVVALLTDRLYINSMAGQDFADAFAKCASSTAQKIMSEGGISGGVQ